MTDRNAPSLRGRVGGFTLIELMITLILFAVLISFAVPSFISFRERAVVRGAAEQLIAAVATARMEAVKRDDPVSVNMMTSGVAWCAGVIEGEDTACNCFATDPAAADFCDLGAFPPLDDASFESAEDQAIAGMRGARLLTTPDFNGDPYFSFDPKLGLLTDVADASSFVVRSPSDEHDYRIQFELGASGKARLCIPTGGRAVAAFRSC